MLNPKTVAAIAVALVVTAGLLMFFVSRDSELVASAQNTTESDSQFVAPGAEGLAAADKNGDGIVYQSGMHPWIVADEPGQCPICGMDLMPVRVDGGNAGGVQIDPVMLQNMGVRTAPVAVESLSRRLRTTGRFVMDEQGSHTVSLKVGGWIEKLHVNFNGMIVHKGHPMLELYSPELVSTQEEYLLALRNSRRLEGTPSARDADRLLEAAKRRLAFWDLSEAQIRELEETGVPSRTMSFAAPAGGEVMNKQVVEGQYVDPGQPLFDVVDVSKIWLIVDVYEQDLAWIRPGVRAEIALPYSPGETFQGRVDYVYHMLDGDSRTARARITMPSRHLGPLRPGMYATVTMEGGEAAASPVVPEEAIVRTGDRQAVIVARGGGRFLPVEVVSGVTSNGRTQILQGLQGDETVVTSAQFLIDSEARLRSVVGAMMGGVPESGAEAASGVPPGGGDGSIAGPSADTAASPAGSTFTDPPAAPGELRPGAGR